MDLPEFKSEELKNAKEVQSSITAPLKVDISPINAIFELRRYFVNKNKDHLFDIGSISAAKQLDTSKYFDTLITSIKLYSESKLSTNVMDGLENKKRLDELNAVCESLKSIFFLLSKLFPEITVDEINTVILGAISRNL